MGDQSTRKRWRNIGRQFLAITVGVSVGEQPVLGRFGKWACYGFAVATVALALLTTHAVQPLREQPPTLLFFAAVVLTSWYAGLRAGFTAAVLSMLALHVVFVKPMFSLQMEIMEDGTDFVAFAAATWLVSTFQDRWRQTHRKLVAVEHEMQIARLIQQRFFPAVAPSLPGFEIAGGCFPAAATGGDFFDYIPMPDGRLAITVGDVSGHGLGPALVMVLLRAYLRALTLSHCDPAAILAKASRLLSEDTEVGWFATVLFLELNAGRGQFVYAGAGHECHVIDASGEVIRLESTGMPLGLAADAGIDQSPPIALRPGQLLLVVSDGILESHSTRGEVFGLARAVETVHAHRAEPAREMVAALYQAACSHRGDVAQEDDMTAVIVKAI